MTDSFFHTHIHPEDIHKTAVTTPLGAYEWCVMPMGLCNSPPIHQRRVMTVLRKHIRVICHVYMDDIIVWSQTIEEHERHVRIILQALPSQDAGLYINKKKTKLFCYETSFLGHIISQEGIKADSNNIYVTTDASDRCTGAVLSFGPTWETARTVAFDSSTLKDAELNYPVHEKELLAIIRAVKKWKYDLIGTPFFVYTDHKTLLNFLTQKELSRRQARWMETLSSYECKFLYVKGQDNTMADALSRYPTTPTSCHKIAQHNAQHPYITFDKDNILILNREKVIPTPLTAIVALTEINLQKTKLEFSIDDDLVKKLRDGYTNDPWCKKLISASQGMPELTIKDGLWFLGERLIIPSDCGMREHIFRLTHDTLGHFVFHKTYEAIRNSYFWPLVQM